MPLSLTKTKWILLQSCYSVPPYFMIGTPLILYIYRNTRKPYICRESKFVMVSFELKMTYTYAEQVFTGQMFGRKWGKKVGILVL